MKRRDSRQYRLYHQRTDAHHMAHHVEAGNQYSRSSSTEFRTYFRFGGSFRG